MAEKWCPPPMQEGKNPSQQNQAASSFSATKGQNSDEHSVGRTVYLSVPTKKVEVLEHFGYREHLSSQIPGTMVEFLPEDQKVKIMLNNSTTVGSEKILEITKSFLGSVVHDTYHNPQLYPNSMKKEHLDQLLTHVLEKVETNCYLDFDGHGKVNIYGLSKNDVQKTKEKISDMLEKTTHSPTKNVGDFTIDIKSKLVKDFICKFKEDFGSFVLTKLPAGAQLVGVKDNLVTFHGVPEEKAKEIVQAFEKLLPRCKLSFKENVCFLLQDAPRRFIDCMLAERGLKCHWSVGRDDMHVEVLALTEDDVENASKLIKKSVVHHSIPVPDESTKRLVKELLESDFADSVWCENFHSKSPSEYRLGTTENFLAPFSEKFSEKLQKIGKSTRSHLCTHVEMSPESKEHFLQKQTNNITDIESEFQVQINLSQNKCEVKGHSNQSVENAATKLRSLDKTLQKRDIISSSPKAKSLFGDKSFLQQLQEKHEFCTLHPKHGYVVEDPKGPLEKYCWFFGPQRVIQAEGKISEAKADIIFCPVDDLFSPYDVGKEIVQKGGRDIRQYLKDFTETQGPQFIKLKEGEVIFEQQTGFIKSHWIAFAVFQSAGASKQDTEKNTKKIYRAAVQHAEKYKCRTVAMPVITSDEGKCKAFVKGIKEANSHWQSNWAGSLRSSTSISELILVTGTENETEDLWKRLGTEAKGGCCTYWSHVRPLSEEEKIRKSPIRIFNEMGSIIEHETFQTTDMIVNSVDLRLEFNAGFVSGQLLKKLGSSVKDECKKKKPNGLNPGEVVTSRAGGHYKDKFICHAGLFPAWDLLNNFSLKVLKCIMLKCLEEADALKLNSVSFPTLGTGTLKYCHKKVADMMVACVEHYGKQNPRTNINLVKFIIYKEDRVLQAFLDACARVVEVPYRLTLEGELEETFSYLESADSTSDFLLRIIPKYPFEKMPLDFLFTLDAELTQPLGWNDIYLNKILNRLEKCVPISQDLQQTVASCLNKAVETQATSVAFAFNKAKVEKQDIDTIANTFKTHVTAGQIMACYILLEDMSTPDLKTSSEAKGQTYLSFSSIQRWWKNETSWVQKKARTADFFRKVHCLTLVTHMRDHLKSLVDELEGCLQRPLEWVLEVDGKKKTASSTVAKELSEGYINPSKQGFLTINGKVYEYDVNSMEMAPLESHNPGSTVRLCIKVDRNLPEEKQMKTEPGLNDVFEGVTAEVNIDLENLLQTPEIADQIRRTSLSITSSKNGHKMCSGKMEDIVRLDTALKTSIERPPRKHSQTMSESDSEDSLVNITNISIPMTHLEYLAVKYYREKSPLWQKVSLQWQNDSLCLMADTKVSDRDAKQLEYQIKENLKKMQSVSWGEVIVEDKFMDKVEDGIREVEQSEEINDVFYHFNKNTKVIHIFSQNYNDITKAKHKIGLAIGIVKISKRRERRFDLGPSKSLSGNQSSSGLDNSLRDNKITGSTDYPTPDTSVFRTSEGLVVRVYPGSILSLDVDCIVNAANGDLKHGGGVAYVISNAAGYKFDKESRDYIYNNGPLGVGEVCTTSAGNLKYKGVIHAVGPRWYDYNQDQKRQCLSDLKIAVKNSLEEADFQRYRSIAIPAISSGIFGVPKELCVQQYYRAVEEYSRSRGHNSTLTEVHFIDKDTHMCQLIQTTFTGCFNGTSGIAAGKSGYQRNQLAASAHPVKQTNNPPQIFRSLSSDERSLTHNSDESDQYGKRSKHMTLSQLGDSKDCYQIGNCLSVYIVCGDIIEATTEAIICPENEQFDGRGSIARTIRKAATETYIEKLKQLILHKRQHKMSEVLEISASGSAWKVVLHVIAPRWDDMAVKDPQKYEKNLRQAYENILRHMDKHDLNTLAVPVLGTGAHMHTTPYATIPEIMVSVFKQFANRIRNRKEVYVFCKDKTLLSPIRDVFNKEFNEDESPDEQRNAIQTERIERGFSSKDKQESVDTPEDCCICMDTVTNPKKLSCGHVFCTDCIDQQFKYKPACPQCGAVHGKITGDQPPGTMTMTTTKPYWGRGSLPGYEGCGIININYHFPSGKQGPDHPTPGKLYQGITRPGFLPDNEKGRLVAKLLRIAFDRKLVFTIGRSRTTGHDGVVTWNDIHHKTRMDGGPQAFGYPDPTYLDRVLDELKAKGVTEESLNDP